jgi:hypothetical protein
VVAKYSDRPPVVLGEGLPDAVYLSAGTPLVGLFISVKVSGQQDSRSGGVEFIAKLFGNDFTQ